MASGARLAVVGGQRAQPLRRRGPEVGGAVDAIARLQALVPVEHREVPPVVAGERGGPRGRC